MPNTIHACDFNGIMDGDNFLETLDWDAQTIVKTACSFETFFKHNLYEMSAETGISKSSNILLKRVRDHACFCYEHALHLYVIYEWEFAEGEKERLETRYGTVPRRNSLGGPFNDE